MAKGAEHWAREIVKARMEDNHALADLLEKNLRDANRERRSAGMKSIRATQHWYFHQGGRDPPGSIPAPGSIPPPGTWTPGGKD